LLRKTAEGTLPGFCLASGLHPSVFRNERVARNRIDGRSIDLVGRKAKAFYNRKRPFDRFKEPSLYPKDDEALSKNGSYPSGHTIRGWSTVLLLSEINPERADTLLARGYMYGESRVIVGAHWQSDVDAGRLAATAAYMKLHTSDAFLEQLKKAKAEFRKKTKVQ
jgi:acid phosphatase (class A)